MNIQELPFNVEILELTQERLRRMRPVKSIDIREGKTDNFHPEGLFSTDIFGRIGSEARDNTFSYIDLGLSIFHPLVFRHLGKLKALYKAIMEKRGYATWDEEKKDFVASDELDGETGFAFFLKHWKEIEFKRTGSSQRDLRVDMIEKYKERALVDKIVVIPAGLRDHEIDRSGKETQHEINDIYRRLIGISNTIARTDQKGDLRVMDNTRVSLQKAFMELFSMLEGMVSGKRGFMQGKWGSRKYFNGTGNVISAMDTATEEMDGERSIDVTQTQIGFYQFSKAALPVVSYHLTHGYLPDIFSAEAAGALLVNKKTWKGERVKVSSQAYDRWLTPEGVEKVLNSMEEPAYRHHTVEVEDYYMALIYVDDDENFRVFHDIDALPEHLDKKYVRPISYIELLYLSGYRHWNSYPGVLTRYPVIGLGSTFPTSSYVKTTTQGEKRYELGMDWERIDEKDHVALEFPKRDSNNFLETLVPHSSRLKGLGGDFDGDQCSYGVLYTKEAHDEISSFFQKKEAFLDPNGGFKIDLGTDTADLVLNNMTGQKEAG